MEQHKCQDVGSGLDCEASDWPQLFVHGENLAHIMLEFGTLQLKVQNPLCDKLPCLPIHLLQHVIVTLYDMKMRSPSKLIQVVYISMNNFLMLQKATAKRPRSAEILTSAN